MKQVLITGGATGIGAATAQVFLERGYRVFVTVHQTAAELPGVTAIPCDITDPADVERLFAAVGTVDVLVNNAGISLIRQIQDTTPEDYDALMGVNCKGVFLCSRAAAVYSMSKAGVIGFTRALAQELAPEGIAVNCVAPGIIDTRMNACFDRAELEAEVPMGRLGTPREVAEAVLYLAESPYVTGQVLGVNGGIV